MDEKLLEAIWVQNWVVYFDREDILKEDVALESEIHIGIEVAVMIVKKRDNANIVREVILNQSL